MNILITGGTGFIGYHLAQKWSHLGHQITIVGRSIHKIKTRFDAQFTPLTWDQITSDIIKKQDVVVNLAGANIGAKRWSNKTKQAILNSRIKATDTIAQLCAQLGKESPHLINASAIGVYGLARTTRNLPPPLSETDLDITAPSTDFSSEVARAWEQAAQVAVDSGVNVSFARFGIVLNKHEGVLPKIAKPYYLGLGGTIGCGYQAISWVSLLDVLSAIDFIIEKKITGPINVVAPQCVTQKQFAKTLAHAIHRPSIVKTPAFTLKLMFGQMADELLIRGQHVYPQVLLDHGYCFLLPTLKETFDAEWP